MTGRLTREVRAARYLMRSAMRMAVITTLAYSGCNRSSAPDIGLPLDKTTPIGVNVFRPKVVESTLEQSSFFGTLEPNRSQTLGFAVGGKLQSVPNDQDRFAANEVIAQLDHSDLLTRRNAIEAEIKRLPPGQASQNRRQELSRQSAALQEQIDKRKLLAPFNCIVERTFASTNSLIGPNAPVVSVIEISKPVIHISLPRRISDRVIPRKEYFFVLNDQTIKGVLKRKSFTEEIPGSIQLIFNVQSDLSKINFAIGQSVEARFNFQTQNTGCWLPLSALRQNSNGLWTVFVVDGENEVYRVRQRLVEVIQVRDNNVLVGNGVENELVVRDGTHRVVADQRVTIKIVTGDESIAAIGDAE